MLSPTLIDDSKHDLTLNFSHHCVAHFNLAKCIETTCICHHKVVHLICRVTTCEIRRSNFRWPESREFKSQATYIPFVIDFGDAMRLNQCINGLGQILHRSGFEVKPLQNLISALINNFALFIHYFDILQNIFSNFAVSLLNS
ncbi:unannotated protein [freshwater metagenome]|uniref:Unannotated protein n=1 Tax=freshwater metagenome TaxID=449393 RepID=A0A6J6FPK2_9ZZZZ